MANKQLNHLTYADAIADVKSLIEYELNANEACAMNVRDYRTRLFINGRIDELHAIDGACDALLSLVRLEEHG